MSFHLQLAIEADVEIDRFGLSAQAAPGTEINATTTGRPSRPLGPRPQSFPWRHSGLMALG